MLSCFVYVITNFKYGKIIHKLIQPKKMSLIIFINILFAQIKHRLRKVIEKEYFIYMVRKSTNYKIFDLQFICKLTTTNVIDID